jgi:hypothetical protein
MAKYLARSCPRCTGYLGIVVRKPRRNTRLEAINGHCAECGYRMAWILMRGKESALSGRHCSSFTPLNFSVLRPGGKKASRNAPKCHSFCLCRAGVSVFVVARPIQDMSAVSITHKTVGIRFATSAVRNNRLANKATRYNSIRSKRIDD